MTILNCATCESKNINLPRINHLREFFKNVGFSDHTQGIFSTISSMSFNPVAIEKHFTIDNDLPGRDNKFAILPKEMKKLKEFLLTHEETMIDHGLNFQNIELSSREDYRGRFDA